MREDSNMYKCITCGSLFNEEFQDDSDDIYSIKHRGCCVECYTTNLEDDMFCQLKEEQEDDGHDIWQDRDFAEEDRDNDRRESEWLDQQADRRYID